MGRVRLLTEMKSAVPADSLPRSHDRVLIEKGHPIVSHSAPASPPLLAVVRLLIERAERLVALGRTSDAHALYAAAVASDPTPVARIAFSIELARSEPQQAIAQLQIAWEDAKRLRDPDLRRLCCQNLASLWQRLGENDLAARYLQLALSAQMESNGFAEDAGLPAHLLIDTAGQWSTTSDTGFAGILLQAASAQALSPAQKAAVASHRGVMAARRNQILHALCQLADAERLFRAAGDRDGSAHTLLNLGHLLQRQQRFVEAQKAFQLAALLFAEIADSHQEALADGYAREAAARGRLQTADPTAN